MRERPRIYRGIGGVIARAVDAAVAMVAPRTGIKRLGARIQLAYEGGRWTRTNPRPDLGSADKHVAENAYNVREVARELDRDDPHAVAAADVLEDNIVGLGITPQAACTPEETGLDEDACDALNDALNAEWQRWSEEAADATGRDGFDELTALVARTMIVDGEALAHAILDGPEIRCELIDADRLANPKHAPDTERMRGGVELDAQLRPIRYHWTPSHPDGALGLAAGQPIAYPVSEGGLSIVQHVFRRKRPGQTRGVSWFAPSVLTKRQLKNYIGSEVIAARAASNYALFIKQALNENDPDLSAVADADGDSGALHYHETLEPGIIQYLNEGEEPFPFTPNRPGVAFAPFVELLLRSHAASLGISYEMLARDFGRMNLSSARALLRECRRSFDRHRRRIVRQFCRPWWENVVRVAVQNGRLQVPATFLSRPQPFLRVRWVASAYGVVDPVTDVEGSVAMVAANLSTPQEEAATFGRDALKVARARAKFLWELQEIEREFDLEPGVLSRPPGQKAAAPAAAEMPGPMDPEDMPDQEDQDQETEPE